jgi:hypothetical protein
MADPATNDPTQPMSLHRDKQTFDDPIRKVGADATAAFDNSESNPTEWAGSEALVSTAPDEDQTLTPGQELNPKVRADALDAGINDADRSKSAAGSDANVIDDDDISDDDEALIDEAGTKKVR